MFPWSLTLSGLKQELLRSRCLYPPEEPMFPKVIGPIPVPVENLKGPQVSLAQTKQERDDWESKFHVSNAERLELQRQLKKKYDLLHQKYEFLEQHGNKNKREQEARSGAWKDVVDKILKEKADMKTAFEAQLRSGSPRGSCSMEVVLFQLWFPRILGLSLCVLFMIALKSCTKIVIL